MSSFAPFFACAGAAEPETGLLDGRADGAVMPPGRVFTGGGIVGIFCVAAGWVDAGGAASAGGLLFGPGRFGSDPRPGGGGGGLLTTEPDVGAGIDAGPAAATDGGSGGGCDACAGGAAWLGGGAGGAAWLGGGAGGADAGLGIPSSVFFASAGKGAGREATCDDDPGGGGGAAGERSDDFFPRPSKISRSDPPPLLSFDIRVS